jgi:hypothetical protein
LAMHLSQYLWTRIAPSTRNNAWVVAGAEHNTQNPVCFLVFVSTGTVLNGFAIIDLDSIPTYKAAAKYEAYKVTDSLSIFFLILVMLFSKSGLK